jgi:hypothetical protein
MYACQWYRIRHILGSSGMRHGTFMLGLEQTVTL